MRTLIPTVGAAIFLLSAPVAFSEQYRLADITTNQVFYNQAGEPQAPAQIKLAAYTHLYADNDKAIFEGGRLYVGMNCISCHGPDGRGGIGPSLADLEASYCDNPEQIFLTILQGRPNSMPAFGDVLPEDSIWKLVAYIKTLCEPVQETSGK